MAESQSPSSLPTSSSSTDHGATAPAGPKLRDSCHACAYSKLKCPKEKPTCSRCAKRGITCEYMATRRGGRKYTHRRSISDNNTNNTNNTSSSRNGSNASTTSTTAASNVTRQLEPLSDWFASKSAISITLPQPQPLPATALLSSIPPSSGRTSNPFQNQLFPTSQSLFSTIPGFSSTDIDELFSTPESLSMPDVSDTNIQSPSHCFSTAIDYNSNDFDNLFDSYPAFENAVSELLTVSSPCSPMTSRAVLPCEEQSLEGTNATGTQCFCLARALNLMKDLFPSSAFNGLDKIITPPSIETVISKNEKAIEAIRLMVECSCSQDGYLLAIISLIVFKVLGWYAAAAGTPTSRFTSHSYHPFSEQVLLSQDSTVVGNYHIDGENSARMAAQLVLSELHRVQSFINQLSMKLKMEVGKHGGGTDTPNSMGCENTFGKPTSPLSVMMLTQLEVDLRKRLKALSSKIIEGLRQGCI